MSPEQVRAKPLDSRTDLFSFGTVLYEMATGMLPFRGESTGVVFDAILNRAPLPASRLNSNVPAKLEDIIHRALEKDRELRYQSAKEMRAELLRLKRDTDSVVTGAGISGSIASGQEDSQQATAARLAPSSVSLPALPASQASQVASVPLPQASSKKNWKLLIAGAVAAAALLIAGAFYFGSHQSKALTEKDTVVLADFANSTGDAVFDDTLKTAHSVSLRQSPFLNVLSDNKVESSEQQSDSACCQGALPARGWQGVYRWVDQESWQPVCAGIGSRELPERRRPRARAGYCAGERKGARRAGGIRFWTAPATRRIARHRTEI
jgi:serine/threonine protein kinase